MARRVVAWACSWGCRRNVVTSRDRMARHEARCYWNPANRACMTCKYDDFELIDDGWTKPYKKRGCVLGLRGPDGKPQYECDSWEADNG